jgi:hypothetical protein
VPALGLYRCRRTKLGYEAVPLWRPSTSGRAPEKRHLNLKIVPDGIRDFGADQGYTPLDLVMSALSCDLDAAWQFRSKQLNFSDRTPIEVNESTAATPPATPEIITDTAAKSDQQPQCITNTAGPNASTRLGRRAVATIQSTMSPMTPGQCVYVSAWRWRAPRRRSSDTANSMAS